MKYPLSYNTWNKEEEKVILNVIKSNNFTMGKKVREFENKFARKFKSKFAVMVNSGSSANLLMLSVLKYLNKKKINNKNKKFNIIAPAIGWSTSYFPITQNDFVIKFVDVDINTLNIDITKIENSIDDYTIGILAINLLGNPCNFESLNKISKKHKLTLIEDNCESLCAKFNNKYTGTFGLMGTQSFFFAHHMQTMEGGMILTNNSNVADFLRSLRAHGWTRDLSKKNSLYKFKNDKFIDKFKFVTPGYCLRPLEIEAATGIVQLKKLDKFIQKRGLNARYFKKLFGNQNWCQIQLEEKSAKSSWYGFNIILRGKLRGKRQKIINKLIKAGVEVRPTMTGNFTKNPVIKYLPHQIKDKLDNSNYIDKNGFFIGNYPKDLRKELDYAYKIIKSNIN